MLLFIVLLSLIFIAVGVGLFFVRHDRGQKEPISALWIAVGMGILGVVIGLMLELVLIPASALSATASLGTLFAGSLGVGVIEEACKFVPLALFIFPKRYFNEHTDGVIYFALAGLAFGLPEHLLYTVELGAGAGVGRIILAPFFHAATTGIVGYFLAKRKLAGKSLAGIAPVLIVFMLVHAVYDFGLLSKRPAFMALSVGIAFSLSAALFLAYQRATQLDQDKGLSIVGNNSFCRSCGAPNPNHNLYCSRCGKNA